MFPGFPRCPGCRPAQVDLYLHTGLTSRVAVSPAGPARATSHISRVGPPNSSAVEGVTSASVKVTPRPPACSSWLSLQSGPPTWCLPGEQLFVGWLQLGVGGSLGSKPHHQACAKGGGGVLLVCPLGAQQAGGLAGQSYRMSFHPPKTLLERSEEQKQRSLSLPTEDTPLLKHPLWLLLAFQIS